MRWYCALVLVMVVARPVAAEPARTAAIDAEVHDLSDPAPEPAPPPITRLHRTAAIALAVMPGILVRGTGSWVVGEKRAAKKLGMGALLGLGAAGIAGLVVGSSGANQYTIIPGVPIIIGGLGLFWQSWYTDIYVAAGGNHLDAKPRATPPWSVETSTSWLHDAYRERALFGASGRLELGFIGLGAGGLLDAAGDAKIGEAEVRVRLLGAQPTGDVIESGNRIVVRGGARVNRDDDDNVTQSTGEIELMGRLDLSHIERSLGASFIELSTGVGGMRIKYAGDRHELDTLLLGRFAWGTYLGRRGEASLYYDHRRDGLAGGLAAWRAAGFLGSLGATADVRVSGPWALRGEVQVGNAWVTTLALGYRGGAQ